MKKLNRRFFIQSLMSLGLFALIPIKLRGFNNEDCETSSDIQGPFYIPNSPNIYNIASPKITSNFLFITGTVYAKDCKTPIPNAVVDVWHANKGQYDEKTDSYLNSDYEDQYYRGKIYTDNSGNYAYKTVLPGKYLNGTLYRPSHIHYKSSYLDQNELTTQLYFEGDSSIQTDPWASNPSAENRIIPLTLDEENNLHGTFDIYLTTSPEEVIDPINNLEENRYIKSIYPNPINEESKIYLQNYNNISIDICDINGKQIVMKNNIKESQIRLYDLFESKKNKGIYIIRVLKNNKPIDSKRFVIW